MIQRCNCSPSRHTGVTFSSQLWCWQQAFLHSLCNSAQDARWALGCRRPQRHSSLVICTRARKFQVSSGWKGKPQSASWTAQQQRCKPKCWVHGTSWYFGNASAVVGTMDGRDVNRLHIPPENLLYIYTCTNLPVKQHQVNYLHS